VPNQAPYLPQKSPAQVRAAARAQVAKEKVQAAQPPMVAHPDVVRVQEHLRALGWHVTVDGIMGPETQTALQMSHNGTIRNTIHSPAHSQHQAAHAVARQHVSELTRVARVAASMKAQNPDKNYPDWAWQQLAEKQIKEGATQPLQSILGSTDNQPALQQFKLQQEGGLPGSILQESLQGLVPTRVAHKIVNGQTPSAGDIASDVFNGALWVSPASVAPALRTARVAVQAFKDEGITANAVRAIREARGAMRTAAEDKAAIQRAIRVEKGIRSMEPVAAPQRDQLLQAYRQAGIAPQKIKALMQANDAAARVVARDLGITPSEAYGQIWKGAQFHDIAPTAKDLNSGAVVLAQTGHEPEITNLAHTPEVVHPQGNTAIERASRNLIRTHKAAAPPDANTPKKLQGLLLDLQRRAIEAADYRKWYANSAAGILSHTNGNVQEADKLAALIAVYSPRAEVYSKSTEWNNLDRAINAYDEYMKTGQISPKWSISSHLEGEGDWQTHRATQIMQGSFEWQGLKTNRFYRNFLQHIDPAKYEQLFGAEKFGTMDTWMRRAFRYPATQKTEERATLFGTERVPTGKKQEPITPKMYSFMEKATQAVADSLGWSPEEAQAAIWTSVKAEAEGIPLSQAGFDFRDAFAHREARRAAPLAPEQLAVDTSATADAPTKAAVTQAAEATRAPDGGFTLTANLNPDNGNTGFAVAYGAWEEKHAAPLTEKALLDYRNKHLALLRSDPSLRVGGWHNPEDGQVYLDISRVLPTREEAMQFAHEQGQLAIADRAALARGDFESAFLRTGLTPEQSNAIKGTLKEKGRLQHQAAKYDDLLTKAYEQISGKAKKELTSSDRQQAEQYLFDWADKHPNDPLANQLYDLAYEAAMGNSSVSPELLFQRDPLVQDMAKAQGKILPQEGGYGEGVGWPAGPEDEWGKATGGGLDPELVMNDARAWLEDSLAQHDPESIANASDAAIRSAIEKHYDGGWEQFFRDGLYSEGIPTAEPQRDIATLTKSDRTLLDDIRNAQPSDFFQGGPKVKGAIRRAADGNYLHLFRGADVSTAMHELAHAVEPLLPEADRMALQVEAFKQIGAHGNYDEWVARSFEKYLAEGGVPAPELSKAFHMLGEDVARIYVNTARIPGAAEQITPEMRQLFGKFFTREIQRDPKFAERVGASVLAQQQSHPYTYRDEHLPDAQTLWHNGEKITIAEANRRLDLSKGQPFHIHAYDAQGNLVGARHGIDTGSEVQLASTRVLDEHQGRGINTHFSSMIRRHAGDRPISSAFINRSLKEREVARSVAEGRPVSEDLATGRTLYQEGETFGDAAKRELDNYAALARDVARTLPESEWPAWVRNQIRIQAVGRDKPIELPNPPSPLDRPTGKPSDYLFQESADPKLEAAAMQVTQGGMSVEDAAKMFGVEADALKAHIEGGGHAAEQERILSNADVGGGAAETTKTAEEILGGGFFPKDDSLATTHEPIPDISPAAQLRQATAGARSQYGKQAVMRAEDNRQRAAELRRIFATVSDPDEAQRLASQVMSGERPKIDYHGFSELSPEAIRELKRGVFAHPGLPEFTKNRVARALDTALNGRVPSPAEMRLFELIWGKQTAVAVAAHAETWGDYVLRLLNIPRTLMATADLSGLARQGLVAGMSHPLVWMHNAPVAWRSMRSPQAYEKFMNDVKANPWYGHALSGGVSFTEIGEHSALAAHEEAFQGDIIANIKGIGSVVKGSARAYTGFLNKMRMDLFAQQMRIALAAGRDVNDEKFLKSLADIVNASTGRGTIHGRAEHLLPALNTVMFSPRLMLSRLNYLDPTWYYRLGHGLDKGQAQQVRLEALRGLVATASAVTSIVWMASHIPGVKVETDPRSSNFGKMQIGNTRLDIAGGFQQYIRIVSEMITNTKISSTTGRKQSLGSGFGVPTRWDELSNFALGKAAPPVGAAVNLIRGKDLAGRKMNLNTGSGAANFAQNYFTPLVWQDSKDLYNDRKGGLNGIAAALGGYGLGAVGVGVQTYGQKDVAAKPKQKLMDEAKAAGAPPPPQSVLIAVEHKAQLDTIGHYHQKDPQGYLKEAVQYYSKTTGRHDFDRTVVAAKGNDELAKQFIATIRQVMIGDGLSAYESAVKTAGGG
jgi:hypothetical protein